MRFPCDLVVVMNLKSLPPPPSLDCLLSFDFDDTLFDPLYPGHFPSDFFERIAQWRDQYGLLWGINTGRDYDYLETGFIEQVKASFAPDFVITMERYIHLADEHFHLRSLSSWNDQCLLAHEELFLHHKFALEQLMMTLGEACPGVNWWRQAADPYSIEVNHPEELEILWEIIEPWILNYPCLSTQRAGPYLRFCHAGYNKGTALEEVIRLFGISPQATFIAGDGHNDMDAMAKIHGALCACPANAAESLKKLVKVNKGYISPCPRVRGMEDILKNALTPWLESLKSSKRMN